MSYKVVIHQLFFFPSWFTLPKTLLKNVTFGFLLILFSHQHLYRETNQTFYYTETYIIHRHVEYRYLIHAHLCACTAIQMHTSTCSYIFIYAHIVGLHNIRQFPISVSPLFSGYKHTKWLYCSHP